MRGLAAISVARTGFADLAVAMTRVASVGFRAHHRLAAVAPLPFAAPLRRLTFVVVRIQLLGSLVAVGVAWLRYCRDLPWTALVAAPLYVVWKIPLYVRFLVRPERRWIRTEREVATESPQTESDSSTGGERQSLVSQNSEGRPR